MPFNRYIQRHYVQACEMQRDIPEDELMVEMVRRRSRNDELIKTWMRNYGLFQGVSGENRDAVVKSFQRYVKQLDISATKLDSASIEAIYEGLFRSLHHTVQRSWMSATSKLLWCVYPYEFVIYDTFVHRTLVVLQCLDDDLRQYRRIGIAPSVETKSEIKAAVDHYMNFQAVVKQIQRRNQTMLDTLRDKYREPYPYDIRIIDKLLWMMGNAKFDS